MKNYLAFILATLAGSLFANSPEQAFNQILDAAYSADADCLQECLSTESVALIDMMLVMVKMKPEEAAVEISNQLGVEITKEELLSWTSYDLLTTVLSAPGFISELPARQDIAVSGFETGADSSMVSFSIADYTGTFHLLLVKDGNDWKLDKSVIQSML